MAQFGSAPVLGTGGRRFKSFHSDMVHGAVVAALVLMLVVSSVASCAYLYKYYLAIKKSDKEIRDLKQELGYARIAMERAELQIEDLEAKEKRLKEANRVLTSKLNKINMQFKQMNRLFDQ